MTGYVQNAKIIIMQVKKYAIAPIVILGNLGKELAQKRLKIGPVLEIQGRIGLQKSQKNRILDVIRIVNDPSLLL